MRTFKELKKEILKEEDHVAHKMMQINTTENSYIIWISPAVHVTNADLDFGDAFLDALFAFQDSDYGTYSNIQTVVTGNYDRIGCYPTPYGTTADKGAIIITQKRGADGIVNIVIQYHFEMDKIDLSGDFLEFDPEYLEAQMAKEAKSKCKNH